MNFGAEPRRGVSDGAGSRRRLRRFLPWLGLLLLGWVLSQLDLRALGHAFSEITLAPLLEASALFGGNLLLKALRWQRMLKAQGFALPAKVGWSAYLASAFYGQVTLGRMGELYRAAPLIERGVPAAIAISSSIYDRLLDLAIVLTVAAVLSALVVGNEAAAMIAAGLLLTLGFGTLALLKGKQLARFDPVKRMRARLEAQRTAVASGLRGGLGLVAQVVSGLDPLLKPRFALESLAWSSVAWLGYFGSLIVVARGLDIHASVLLLLASSALAALSTLLPITISGLGAREVVFMHVLALEHVEPARAVVLSLLHFGMMTATAITLGLIGVIAQRRIEAAP